VREAQQRINAAEFSEWLMEYKLDPWGGDRADWRAAMIASTMCNIWSGSKNTTYKPADFMPQFNRSKRKKTTREMADAARAFCEAQAAFLGARRRQP